MGNLVDRCMAGGREATQSAVDLRTIWFVEKVSAEAEAGFGNTGHPARARPSIQRKLHRVRRPVTLRVARAGTESRFRRFCCLAMGSEQCHKISFWTHLDVPEVAVVYCQLDLGKSWLIVQPQFNLVILIHLFS